MLFHGETAGEACSDVSDAENRDPWNLPQVMHIIISVQSDWWPLIHLKHGVATWCKGQTLCKATFVIQFSWVSIIELACFEVYWTLYYEVVLCCFICRVLWSYVSMHACYCTVLHVKLCMVPVVRPNLNPRPPCTVNPECLNWIEWFCMMQGTQKEYAIEVFPFCTKKQKTKR